MRPPAEELAARSHGSPVSAEETSPRESLLPPHPGPPPATDPELDVSVGSIPSVLFPDRPSSRTRGHPTAVHLDQGGPR